MEPCFPLVFWPFTLGWILGGYTKVGSGLMDGVLDGRLIVIVLQCMMNAPPFFGMLDGAVW